MILRLSSSAERGALLIVAVVVAAILSYFSIRNARAAHFAGMETLYGYQRATRLEPGNPRNWYLLGHYLLYNIEEPDTASAIRAYRTALDFDPLSWQVWLDLGTAYELEGNIALARGAFVSAKKTYPLSAEVAWRYGNFLLRQGELDPAFAEIRHAVEAEPKRGAEAYSRCMRVDPDIQKILDSVLPPLPGIYVDIIWDLANDGQTDDALKIWNRLASLHTRIPMEDSYVLVEALRRKASYADALRVWNQAAALAGYTNVPFPRDSAVWDGGFETGFMGGQYAWRIPDDVRTVEMRIDSREKHSGNYSLRMTFDGRSNLNFTGPCTIVAVQPSTAYMFSAWVHTRALTTDQGLRFQIRTGVPEPSVAATSDFRGNLPWTQIQMPWSSGTDIHEAQLCIIRKPSDQEDNRIQGRAWVDDVALIPQPAESPKP